MDEVKEGTCTNLILSSDLQFYLSGKYAQFATKTGD